MDKEMTFEEHMRHQYKCGLRARLLHDEGGGDVHVYTQSHYDRYLPVGVPEFWHALRAYQDEQRKKGVPIKIGHIGESWLMLDFKADGSKYEFDYKYGGDIWLRVFNGQNSQCHARFTNFRWREGYPKGGQL